MTNLKSISTKELVEELITREGVSEIQAKPSENYVVKTEKDRVTSDGPARILVVID